MRKHGRGKDTQEGTYLFWSRRSREEERRIRRSKIHKAGEEVVSSWPEQELIAIAREEHKSKGNDMRETGEKKNDKKK
jgi:hypothetical protein